MDLLVLDADIVKTPHLKRLAEEAGIVVATDRAAERISALGVNPDVIVGDLDTADPEYVAKAKESSQTVVLHNPDQDKNDCEKGLQYLVDNGADEIFVMGISGGMVDHILNNFSILTRFAAECTIQTVQDNCVGYFITDKLSINTNSGERVSIIPMPGAQVTTKGLRWDIDGEVIAWAFREGASNMAVSDKVEVSVQNGTVILFHYSEKEVL